jgi:hypothetical protein
MRVLWGCLWFVIPGGLPPGLLAWPACSVPAPGPGPAASEVWVLAVVTRELVAWRSLAAAVL